MRIPYPTEINTQKMDWYNADLVVILCAPLLKKPRSRIKNKMITIPKTPKRIVSRSLSNIENESMSAR
jgi:hypothetical protein